MLPPDKIVMEKYVTQQDAKHQVSHILVQSENLDFLINEKETNQFSLIDNVDVCYIDPPYNTGKNFTYKDANDNWLQFMRDRLLPLKILLKDTGVVIVSIDDNEVHYLRVLMDEVFGRNNFIAQLVIDGGSQKNNAKYFSVTHEYMLVYANNLSELKRSGIVWRKEREGIDILLNEYEKQKKNQKSYNEISSYLKQWVKTQSFSDRLKMFTKVDAHGVYTYADLSTPGKGGKNYDVLHPLTGKPCVVPSRGWGLSEEKLQQLIDEDMIIFGKDEKVQPLKKVRLHKRKDQVQNSILSYPARTSTHMLEKMLGRRLSFTHPKNLDMMKDLLNLVTPPDGVVLDYFGGSGTTGHAVIEINEENSTTRKFVLVTNNENNIFTEVTVPRLQLVIDQTKEDQGLLVYEEK